MNKRDFEHLKQGVRELGAVLRGKTSPARVRMIKPKSVKAIRSRFKLSQSEFARLLGVPTGTLRNWEQGVRQPQGPARALLRVAALHPEAVLSALHDKSA